jgi:hypothetical protein
MGGGDNAIAPKPKREAKLGDTGLSSAAVSYCDQKRSKTGDQKAAQLGRGDIRIATHLGLGGAAGGLEWSQRPQGS